MGHVKMHIISKYKDYYDYLSFIYGIDKKNTWERNIKTEVNQHDIFLSMRDLYDTKERLGIKLPLNYGGKIINGTSINDDKSKTFNFKSVYLYVHGKIYQGIELRLTVNKTSESTTEYFFDTEHLKKYLFVHHFNKYINEISNTDKKKNKFNWNFYKTHTQDQHRFITKAKEKIENAIKEHKTPILMAHEHGLLTINPNLSTMGIPDLIPAETIYQEIDMCLSALNNNEQIVVIADKDKIAQHGFNDKSFRNPIR